MRTIFIIQKDLIMSLLLLVKNIHGTIPVAGKGHHFMFPTNLCELTSNKTIQTETGSKLG